MKILFRISMAAFLAAISISPLAAQWQNTYGPGDNVYSIAEEKEEGNYEVGWNATGFASGVYFYKLTAGVLSETRKLILLK